MTHIEFWLLALATWEYEGLQRTSCAIRTRQAFAMHKCCQQRKPWATTFSCVFSQPGFLSIHCSRKKKEHAAHLHMHINANMVREEINPFRFTFFRLQSSSHRGTWKSTASSVERASRNGRTDSCQEGNPPASPAQSQKNYVWLVVWTPLKNISQLGWLFPIYGKIKNVSTCLENPLNVIPACLRARWIPVPPGCAMVVRWPGNCRSHWRHRDTMGSQFDAHDGSVVSEGLEPQNLLTKM